MTDEFSLYFDSYARRIVARQPMAMVRFGDGELMLTDGHAVSAATQASQVDRWQAPRGLTQLGRRLQTTLSCEEPNLHFGIPCQCCNPVGNARLKAMLKRSPLFPANLFINANYPRFQALLRTLQQSPVGLVVNQRAMTCRLPFRALREQRVPDDCVQAFEQRGSDLMAASRNLVADLRAMVVLVAAGPLSEALIQVMWNSNPHNTYVDVGSALDEYLYGQKTRPYQIAGTGYAQRQCVL